MIYIGFVQRERGTFNFIIPKGFHNKMTYLEVVFPYSSGPGEHELRAIDSMREVYGVRRVQFNEKDRLVRVEFDASRLTQDVIAGLLRQAGIDVRSRCLWRELENWKDRV